MREHCRNAHAVAGFLERHPRVEQVLYPGLPTHPGHAIAARQMRDFGGMVSFLAESEEEAVAICARTKIFQLAESLGGVESLIEHPGPDDARLDRRRAVRGAAEPRAALGRDRVGGRPGRRPRGRARPLDGDRAAPDACRGSRSTTDSGRRLPPASRTAAGSWRRCGPDGSPHDAFRRWYDWEGRPRAARTWRTPGCRRSFDLTARTRPGGLALTVLASRRPAGRLAGPATISLRRPASASRSADDESARRTARSPARACAYTAARRRSGKRDMAARQRPGPRSRSRWHRDRTRGCPEPLDLRHLGHERVIGSYLLETDDGLALHDCGPTTCVARAEGRPRRARPRAHRRPPPAALATSTSTTRAPRACSSASTPGCRCTSPRSARRTSSTRAGSRRARGGSTATTSTRSGASSRRSRRRTSGRRRPRRSGSTASRPPATRRHHVCYLDGDGTLYAGDAAGVRDPAGPLRPAADAAARGRRRGLVPNARRDRAARSPSGSR